VAKDDEQAISLHSEKKERNNHGYGVKIIRRIVDKYDGVVTFERDKEKFKASVLLPVKMLKDVTAATKGADLR
jgi:sensor histidine kinase regulating citrate/malate metabolism